MASNPVPLTDQQDAAAEPCPTPLSTVEVLESFDREGDAWEIEGPFGPIQGHNLGEGLPLYFLNGLEATSELFRLVAWLLKDEFRCVLYDAPAVAESGKKPADAAIHLPDVRQLWAVADSQKDETFQIYGSGFGGWLGLAAMSSRPERISGAILQAAYANRRFRLIEKLLLFAAKRSARTFTEVPGWQAVFAQNHRRWFPPFDAVRFEIFQQIAGKTSVRDLSQRICQLKQFSLESHLTEISQPVLLLNAEGEGRLLQRQREVLERKLPDARSEWLQNSGLVPHWTHPHRVAKLVRQFLLPGAE